MNKTAMITGANRGIGRALVEEFSRSGYDIWACARTPNAAFEADMRGLTQNGGGCIHPVYFDLSNESDIKNGIKQILSEKRKIDVLINNAGIAYGGSFLMTPMSKLREVYEINVFAQVQIMQYVAREMMRQRSGCIINMCSIGGIEANPGYLAYGSSKAALIWITRCAARELGAYNIRVNGLAPGLIETDMGHYKNEEERNKILSRMCMSRVGLPEEIAKAAKYLASEDAAFITGQILAIDGGRIL